MKKTFARNTAIVVLAAALGTSGCVTTNTNNPSQSSGSSLLDGGCSTGIAAIVGAVAGGLIASGNNRVKGAALGAGLASLACVAWNYQATQTKTAAQVQTEYRQANAGRLPAQTQVVAFNTTVDPNATVVPGNKITVTSQIEVVQGTDGRKPVIEEELTLVKPDESEVKTRKVANDNGGAGGFTTSFAMTMPKGVPQGTYPVRTVLLMDGVPVKRNNLSLQVVAAPNGQMLASIQ